MDLKPCPFCGGRADAFVQAGANHWLSVACRSCGAAMEDDASPEGAVVKWNRRSNRLRGRPRLAEAVVASIRDRVSKSSIRSVAREFGISPTHVHRIKRSGN